MPKISDILLRTSVELNIFDSPLYLSRNDGGLAWDQAVVKRLEDLMIAGSNAAGDQSVFPDYSVPDLEYG